MSDIAFSLLVQKRKKKRFDESVQVDNKLLQKLNCSALTRRDHWKKGYQELYNDQGVEYDDHHEGGKQL